MHVWSGVMIAAAALLVVTGPPKLLRPAATITALRSVGAVWVGRRTVRVLAIAEVVAGSVAAVVGGRAADGAVALLYLGFSGFLVLALRTPTASCGCASRDDTPPTVGHLVMTTVFAVGAAAAAFTGGRTGLISMSRDAAPGQIAAAVGFALIATWLAWTVLTISVRVPTPRRT
jgi:hypothetical protein